MINNKNITSTEKLNLTNLEFRSWWKYDDIIICPPFQHTDTVLHFNCFTYLFLQLLSI